MRTRRLIAAAIIALASAAYADDLDQKVTYWLSESGSDGWSIQNLGIDLPIWMGSERRQPPRITNIALNRIYLEDDVLRDPAPREDRYSLTFDYPDSVAAQSIGAALPALGSLQKTIAYLVANQAYLMREELNIASNDTLLLMRTVQDSGGVAGVTTTVASWPLP